MKRMLLTAAKHVTCILPLRQLLQSTAACLPDCRRHGSMESEFAGIPLLMRCTCSLQAFMWCAAAPLKRS